jgi:hypothetical protein
MVLRVFLRSYTCMPFRLSMLIKQLLVLHVRNSKEETKEQFKSGRKEDIFVRLFPPE